MALLRRLRQVDAFNNGLDKLCIQVDSILDYNAEAVVPVDVNGTPLGTNANPMVTTGGAGGAGGPPALATAAAPTYVEGAGVALSVDLAGNLRTLGGGGGSATTDVTDRAARLVGHVTVDNFPATQPVSGTVTATGPLTDTQLRAVAVPVSGPLTDAQLRAAVVPVDVTPVTPAANDYLPVRLTDGTAFYTAGAGGGGGAATIADGADVAEGTTTDAAWTSGAGTVVGLLKAAVNAIKATLTADITDRAARLLGHVTVDNASIPVTGTFWQATQPVSGTVTANAGTGTMAVSGPLTDAQLRAAAVTVQGNQSSLTTGNIIAATTVVGPLTVSNYNIVTVGVSGTYAGVSFVFEASYDGTNWFTMQGTRTDSFVTENGATALTNVTRAWDVPIGYLTSFRVRATAWTSGTAVVGMGAQAMPYEPSPNVGIAAIGGTAVSRAGVLSIMLNQGAVSTGVPQEIGWAAGQVALRSIVDGITVNKTTAAASTDVAGVMTLSPNVPAAGNVRALKDSGRSSISLNWEEMTGTAAVESTLTNFTSGAKAASALTAATNYTVTAAKTLRITSINVYVKSTSTALLLARFRLRQAASAIANTSPIIWDYVFGSGMTTTASGTVDHAEIAIPDGLEVAAGQQVTFTWFTSANSCTVGLTLTGFEY